MRRSWPARRWGLACLLLLAAAWPAGAQQWDAGKKETPDGEKSPSSPAPLPEGERGEERMPAALDHLRRPLTTARPDPALPAGEIRVLVLDGEHSPAAGVQVVLASLKPKGEPDEMRAATDENGRCAFVELPVGTGRSYVARVDHQGAAYRSPPFYLPLDNGYQVVLHRPDTTRDPSKLLAMSGRAAVEMLDQKLRVAVNVRLVNTGRKTYRFPEEGLVVKLPPGFSSLQIPPTMQDRRAIAREGEGVALFGSLPPGANELAWQFDLPVAGRRADLSMRLPWPVMTFQVVALAVDDLQIEVRGSGEAQEHEHEGRRFLVAEIRHGPDDEDVHDIAFSISGFPGPGPLRWVALLLSLLAIAVGVGAALRPPGKRVGASPSPTVDGCKRR